MQYGAVVGPDLGYGFGIFILFSDDEFNYIFQPQA